MPDKIKCMISVASGTDVSNSESGKKGYTPAQKAKTTHGKRTFAEFCLLSLDCFKLNVPDFFVWFYFQIPMVVFGTV